MFFRLKRPNYNKVITFYEKEEITSLHNVKGFRRFVQAITHFLRHTLF